MAHQLETLVTDQMLDIAARAGEEIIDAKDFMALAEQALAEMGAEETGAAGHENTASEIHSVPFRRKILRH